MISIDISFYLNGERKLGKTICVDKLKTLMDGWDFCEELESVSNIKPNNASEYWYQDFLGYICKKDWDCSVELTDGKIYLPKYYDFSKLKLTEKKSDDCYPVYFWKVEQIAGRWYSSDSFYKAKLSFENLLAEEQKELYNLTKLKNSIEYYKLNEEQRNDLQQDLLYKKDTVKELENKIYICQYMVDLFDNVLQLFGGDWEDYIIGFITID